jgi:serine/threonine-protein kinase
MTAYVPGQLFADRYTIVDLLGQGGMGVVYKAYDRELDRTVALKMIRQELAEKPKALLRFRRELGLAQQVTHPNVCRVHDLGEAEGVRYLSMEYLEGHTLADLVQQMHRLSVRQALEIAEHVCAGLEAIHAQGIIHRDLKPSNILVTPSGRAVVMDFGIARRPLDSTVTDPGSIVGSYAYLAPEQIRGVELDARTDIYALGLLLYELLAGRRPPGDEDPRPLALRGEHAVCPPLSRHEPEVPAALDSLVLRCLAWLPDERPAKVAEIRAALNQIGTGESGRPGRRLDSRQVLRWAPMAVLAVVGVLALLLIAPELYHRAVAPEGGGAEPAQSIAVLPFHYVGAPSEHQYLGTLVADALIASLQSVPGLAVAPYGSVYEVGVGRPITEVARTLNVRWVVQGTVSTQRDKLAVTARLTSADGKTVWNETLHGSLARLLPALEPAKAALVQTLQVAEGGSPGPPISQLRSPSVPAYRKYLEARRHHEGWDVEENLAAAISLYREALESDPEFAAAHAGVATALVTEFYRTNEAELVASASAASRRALALAPELPEARLASGFVAEVTGSSVEAEANYAKAIELAPGNDAAHRQFAGFFADLGRNSDARAMFERALALRPADWRNHYDFGRFLLLQSGDIEEGREYLDRAAELYPDGPAPVITLGYYDLMRGALDEAQESFRTALERSPHPMAEYGLGLVHYYRGGFELALRSWRAVLERVPDEPMYHSAVGDALRHLDENDQAQAYYGSALKLLRRALASNPQDPETRASLPWVLAAMGKCEEARTGAEQVLSEYPNAPEYAYIASVTAILCGDQERAEQIVLGSIDKNNLVGIRFDPDLEAVRQVPEVRQALERAGSPRR